MFAPVRKGPERLQAVDRVERWTRERFKLPKEAAISVAEVACSLPGCAPLEPFAMFWIAEHRYQSNLLKPWAEGGADDLPSAWLKDGLAVPEGAGWDSC